MKTKPPEATKTVYPILRQIVNLIPPNIFHAAASATKDLSRVFTPWSHAVALIYQWQIWTGLLVHLLLRFLKFLAKWKLSFSRLAGVVRAAVWVRRNVVQLLETYGTAGGWKSDVPKPKPLYLQGFLPFTMSPMGRHPDKSQGFRAADGVFLKTSSKAPSHRRGNAKAKRQFRRLALSGFASMGC